MQQEPIFLVGSFWIKHYVLDSFYQVDERFSETFGIQFAFMALIALCWSVIMKISIRRDYDFDYRVES